MRTDPKEGIGVDAQVSRSVDGAAAHWEGPAGSSLGRAGVQQRNEVRDAGRVSGACATSEGSPATEGPDPGLLMTVNQPALLQVKEHTGQLTLHVLHS